MKWRPRFAIASHGIDFAPMFPQGVFAEPIDTVGGTLEAGSGAVASFVVRRDHWLTVPVRVDETEVAEFFAFLRAAQSGGAIVWTPDRDVPGVTFAVRLAAPTGADDVTPEPDGSFPAVGVVTLTLRKADGSAWDLDYFDGHGGTPTPRTAWTPRLTFGDGPTVFRFALPMTPFRSTLGGLGGVRFTATGAQGAWKATDRSRLGFSLRFTAAEWPSVRAWLAWAQTGAAFTWTPDPDNLPGISHSVYLDGPQAGSRVDPFPDPDYPRVRLLPVLIRRTDGADFDLPYFPTE